MKIKAKEFLISHEGTRMFTLLGKIETDNEKKKLRKLSQGAVFNFFLRPADILWVFAHSKSKRIFTRKTVCICFYLALSSTLDCFYSKLKKKRSNKAAYIQCTLYPSSTGYFEALSA